MKERFGFSNPKRSFMILHSFQDPSCVLFDRFYFSASSAAMNFASFSSFASS